MDSIFTERLAAVECALDKALPVSTADGWKGCSFGSLSDSITAQHIQPLITPCRMLMTLGGKRWRPLLLVLCAELARTSRERTRETAGSTAALSEKDTYRLTPLVEFVHTASLIHDDIEDSADMRRGKPSAYITYGLDTAVNSASWLYFEAPVCIDSLPLTPDAKYMYYNLYTQELRRLHLGQAMDIAWHRNPELYPSLDEYTAMVQCKTGTLVSLAVQTGFLAGGGTKQQAQEAGKIAAEIGVGFQILDDVQNLTTGNPGKKRGDDIVEGKKSLPVLLYITEHPADKQRISSFFESARKGGINEPAVEQCIEQLTAEGSVAEAAKQGQKLIAEKCGELVGIYGDPDTAIAILITKLFNGLLPNPEVYHA